MAKSSKQTVPFKTITVGIASDAIEKISKVQPDLAVEELIWNAIDAEASRIEVIFYENALKGIDRIVISDNGHGISEKDAENIFGNIGGSPKRLRRRSPIPRERRTGTLQGVLTWEKGGVAQPDTDERNGSEFFGFAR